MNNNQNNPNMQSYQNPYWNSYGNNDQNYVVGNQELENRYQQMQMQAQMQQMANINNSIGINPIRPQDNIIVDNIANLEYAKRGYNNVSMATSQYGLADLDAGDWFKYNMILLIPIFNAIYYFYYTYLKAFIKYPILKEWAKSAIVVSILIDILYIIIFVFLFIPL